MRSALAAAALAVLLCAPFPARAADPVEINVVIPVTGPGSSVGQMQQTTLRILEKLYNQQGGIGGRPVRFAIHDDQSNPAVSVQLVSQILASGATIVLGSSLSGACNADGPLFGKSAIEYCFSPGIHPPPGAPVFTSLVATDGLIDTMLRNFRLRGWKRIALIASTDGSGQDGERGVDAALARPELKDVTLVALEHFGVTDVSVSAQIARIKAAQPQALITWTTGLQWGTILKDLANSGLEVPVGSSGSTQSFTLMERFATTLPKELYFAVTAGSVIGDIPRLDRRIAANRKQYNDLLTAAGERPDVGSESVWDSTTIVVNALRKLGPNATGEQLREYISHLKYAGLTGLYDFEREPQRGVSRDSGIVARWNPERKIFEPASLLGGGLLAR
jgi:branched-chain amino acid transport system substrate-binding protein